MEDIKSLSNRQLVSILSGAVAIGYGCRAILSPFEFARDFGLPQAAKTPSNPFIATTGGRTAALGIAIVSLSMTGNVGASGIILVSCVFSGLTDTLCTVATGDKNAFIQHAMGTMVLGSLGWYLTKSN